jgi:hypothetical protein
MKKLRQYLAASLNSGIGSTEEEFYNNTQLVMPLIII